MWSAECCCIALFREPIKWLVFDVQNTCFRFACRSVSYFGVLENLFCKFYCKEKEKDTKGHIIMVSNFMNNNDMQIRLNHLIIEL